MALIHNSNIVRNGLVLHLDAANRKSYSGSGTTWFDLSGRNNTCTLFNSPTFSSNSFVFDGLNDHMSLTNANTFAWTPQGSIGNSTFSIEFWIRTSDNDGNFISKPWNGGGGYNYIVSTSGFTLAPVTINFQLGANIGFASSLNDNIVHQVVIWANGTNFGYYIDGVKTVGSAAHGFTADNPGGNPNSQIGLTIMSLYPYGEGWAGNNSFSIQGQLFNLKFYNRVLTSLEVVQNFNSIRDRYGI